HVGGQGTNRSDLSDAARKRIGDFLATGALIVSIGVALATWIRPVGRAITVSVVGYLLAGLVWPMVVEVVGARFVDFGISGQSAVAAVDPYRVVQHSLISLSPIHGSHAPLLVYGLRWWRRGWFWVGLLIVVLVKLLGAWALFGLTVRTFDRCLGRIPEKPSSRRPGRTKKRIVENEMTSTA
ncbi:hypothetical protein ACYOEI_37945, partial [Singulisphaera rosea]